MHTLSVIVPTLNEAESISGFLKALQWLRKNDQQVIVVDGGSHDETIRLAQDLADVIIQTDPGRAHQMNHGAEQADGDILLFLHADTLLPLDADKLIIDGLKHSQKSWGRFNVRLAGRPFLLRIIETLMNWRSKLTGIATGDQGIFVQKNLFTQIGGFPEIALMEDIALSKKLKHTGRPLCIKQRVITSSRRWEKYGIIKTVVLMWRLRFGYYVGVDPKSLANSYQKN